MSTDEPMMDDSKRNITQLLIAWGKGDQDALEALAPEVQRELHRLALHYMAGEGPGHVLQATALVNEAYLKLVDWKGVQWTDRAHFFGIAANMMRRVLVDYARSKGRSKRGGGALTVSLEVMRALAAVRPRRDCLFVAMSGHELAFMGINPYLRRRPGLIKHAEAWIFFGSDIGAPRQPNLIQASDDALERWIVTALENERLAVDTEEQHSSIARGEMGTVQRGGGRFVTLACASQVYHNAADRWPEAIDVSRLARHARALASGALDLA